MMRTPPQWAYGPEPDEDDLDFAPCEPDLASTIAAEIMGLKWTHGGTEDEHCYRYGELQEIIAKHLGPVIGRRAK